MARRRFPDPRPGYRTHREPTVVGVASTGQISKKGTVTFYDHWMGERDAKVAPQPVSMKLNMRTRVVVPARVAYDERSGLWLPVRKR